eukprot:4005321-Alexandrium_andersonii.AAC.1
MRRPRPPRMAAIASTLPRGRARRGGCGPMNATVPAEAEDAPALPKCGLRCPGGRNTTARLPMRPIHAAFACAWTRSSALPVWLRLAAPGALQRCQQGSTERQ